MISKFKDNFAINCEIFDQGVFPISCKFTLLNLMSLFGKLNSKANFENRITFEEFRDAAKINIPSFTSEDAEIYWNLYKVLIDENKNKNSANVKTLGVFLFLQLYSTTNIRNNFVVETKDSKKKDMSTSWSTSLNNSQFNEAIKGNTRDLASSFSPLHSPRSKTTRLLLSEQQQILYYVKYNLKTILRFISCNIDEDKLLTPLQLNMLGFLIQPKNDEKKNEKTDKLSNLIPNFTAAAKMDVGKIVDFMSNNLISNESGNSIHLTSLSRSVTIKDSTSCENSDLKIMSCEDSFIYITATVNTVFIQNCTNTTIFVAACKKICTVEKCENISITVCTTFLRIGNTIDSVFHYYGPQKPVLYGDNRSISLAPHNANCLFLLEKLKDSGIGFASGYCEQYAQPFLLNNINITYKVVKPQDFTVLALPPKLDPLDFSIAKENIEKIAELFTKKNTPIATNNLILPLLAPQKHKEEISKRYQKFAELQKKVFDNNFTEDDIKNFHLKLQGHFREWMINTGSNKSINDILKMMDYNL